MSCRRAREIDLVAYLVEPGDPRWREFREHYPACPDCAAELTEATALETSLRASRGAAGGRHPAPEVLARAARTDVAAGDPERAALEHVRSCLRCADELEALRGFDFGAVAGAPALTTRGKLRSLKRRAKAALGGGRGDASPADRRGADGLPGHEPALVFQSTDPEAGGRGPTQAPIGVLAGTRGAVEGRAFALHAGSRRLGRGTECEIRIAGAPFPRRAARIDARPAVEPGGEPSPDAGPQFAIEAESERIELVVNGAPTQRAKLSFGDSIEIEGCRFELRRPEDASR